MFRFVNKMQGLSACVFFLMFLDHMALDNVGVIAFTIPGPQYQLGRSTFCPLKSTVARDTAASEQQSEDPNLDDSTDVVYDEDTFDSFLEALVDDLSEEEANDLLNLDNMSEEEASRLLDSKLKGQVDSSGDAPFLEFEKETEDEEGSQEDEIDDNQTRQPTSKVAYQPKSGLSEKEELADYLQVLSEIPVGGMEIEDLVQLKERTAVITESLMASQQIDEQVANTCEKLLLRMVHEWQYAADQSDLTGHGKLSLLVPTDQDFLRVIQTCRAATGGDTEDNRKAEREDRFGANSNALPRVEDQVVRVFQLQKHLLDQCLDSVEPSSDTYISVLQVLSSSRDRGSDRKVLSLFREIPVKTVEMYAITIQSVAKSRDRGAAQRAEELLKEGAEMFPPTIVDGKPSGLSIDSYNVVLTAWAKSGLDYGPERAEKLIVFMDDIDTVNGSLGLVKPNIFSFTSLIDAHTQKNDWDGASDAERILRRMLDQYLNVDDDEVSSIPEPSVASWNIVISAWGRLSKKGFRGAASRAGKLLNWMESLYEDGKLGFGPDSIVYATCMNAYAFSKAKEGPAKAEEILDLMYELYTEGDETMKPNARSVRIVIDAWTRSNATDVMDDAEILLERYEEFLDAVGPPNDPVESLNDVKDIYRNMLFGFAKKGDPTEAQKYLHAMIDKGMEPDCFCYDKIIESNTQLNDEKAFERTYQVFQLMEENRKQGQVMPNERVYTSFIRAMTKACVPNLAKKSSMMLHRMEDLYAAGNKGIQPTVFAYNAVLMACAETLSTPNPEPMEAFRVSIKIFNDLRNSKEEPDHVSFGNMLRCANLLPDGDQKDGVIKNTFVLSCRAGFVNEFVIRDLQKTASEDLWHSLLGLPAGNEVNMALLPSEWKYKFQLRKQKKPFTPKRRSYR